MDGERHEHIDANVNMRQSVTWPVVLQALAMLAGLAAVYANGVANDRELRQLAVQNAADIARVEAAQRDVKGDIRGELVEIRVELRELRQTLASTRERRP